MDNESSRNDKLESRLQDGSSEPVSLSLEYLRKITDNFSNDQLLGIGGFGKVYKGVHQNGECIAVKKLDQLKETVQKPQFENEVYHLMRFKHPNIVRFVGYCYETRNECVFYDGKYVFAEIPQKLVCLEYLTNGSLDRHLSDESSGLDWYTRHKIIRGTCFGLHYLHEECKSQFNASIIHLDLKPANILLDDNMVPKIADFGLSKLFDIGKTQTHTTSPAGSLGYMAPEYIYQHIVSTKADIYSLGAIIIEVITGRMFGPSGIEKLFCKDFVEPVLKNWRNRLEATPTCTSPEIDCQQIEICLEIGLSCTNFDPGKRPTTTKIVKMLNRYESANCDEERLAANQPPIVALGPVSNVSSPIAVNAERPDRILPAVLTSGLAPMDASRTPDVKPRITDEFEKVKTWKLADIVDNGHLRALPLTDTDTNPSKVVRLLYTNNGIALLALGSNAVHKLWKWQRSDRNPSGKSTASIAPHLWHQANGILMTNDINDGNPEEATACIALSKNDSYIMSASGGKISLFNMMTFKVITAFMAPPPAATFLAFHPQDNNIIAIGTEDSTIIIYNARTDGIKSKLKGHQKKITGLAFSQSMNVLVSSCADAQLCVWSIDGWEKKKSRYIQLPANRPFTLVGDTRVQFHNDQRHLLVVHESQLAIYDRNLECSCSWSPSDALPVPISSAIYSCDGLLVYAAFCDGAIGVFEAESLRLRCRIAPSAYIPPSMLAGAGRVYPLVIAAHPMEPNQIALGMSDGKVHVVEPLDGDPKWGTAPPQDNGAHPQRYQQQHQPLATNQASDQPTR